MKARTIANHPNISIQADQARIYNLHLTHPLCFPPSLSPSTHGSHPLSVATIVAHITAHNLVSTQDMVTPLCARCFGVPLSSLSSKQVN